MNGERKRKKEETIKNERRRKAESYEKARETQEEEGSK